MDIIEKAFVFAYEKHATQKRKTRDCPYVCHLMEVAATLIKENASPELVAAGFLHDAVEDNEHTGVTETELRKEFGDKITDLVMHVTERDKGKSWKERKEESFRMLEGASRELLLLKCADKLNNLTDMLQNRSVHGDKMWSHFGAGKKEQLWYFRTNLELMTPISDTMAYKEYKLRVEELARIVEE